MFLSFMAILMVMGFLSVDAETCPNGASIYARGVSAESKKNIVNKHNSLRADVANGRVHGQPKASNMKRMVWNEELAKSSKVVSNSCKFNHILAKSNKWNWVGQNIYISCSSSKTFEQNWSKAVQEWFNEHTDFIYPTSKKPGKKTGHYTQVVWAKSDNVGCDYIFFYDRSKPDYPHCKLYTCNYGPGGNIIDRAPYLTGRGCEQLC